VNLGRSNYYRPKPDRLARDAPVIDRLNQVVGKHGRWGFWKCFHWMRLKGETWNHKRVWRVYKSMRLNLPRRAKKRLPARVKQPLDAPAEAGRQWSMDFMSDTLFCGKRFRTLNVFDEGVREVLAIEVDTSLPAERVIRLLEQLKDSHPLPQQIRVDNGPEFVSSKLVAWCENHGIHLHHIQPGKPAQNAYVERLPPAVSALLRRPPVQLPHRSPRTRPPLDHRLQRGAPARLPRQPSASPLPQEPSSPRTSPHLYF
jgi:putative transposase